MKRQLKKPKFWFTDSAEAEKQTENNTSLTENVLFVIDNAMTQMQEQRIKNRNQKSSELVEIAIEIEGLMNGPESADPLNM